MAESTNKLTIPDEVIMNKIYLIRGKKVMLDRDLAELYGVETKVLKQTVRRKIKRFPSDFMLEMTIEELQDWRSQFVTSNADKKGLRYPPFCFSEHGVIMLAEHDNQILVIFEYLKQLEQVKQQELDQEPRKIIKGYRKDK